MKKKPPAVSKSHTIFSLRIGPFKLSFDRIEKEGGIELLEEMVRDGEFKTSKDRIGLGADLRETPFP